MLSLIWTIIVPLTSLFIFMLGNGLYSTLLTLRLHMEGSSAIVIGAMMSAYYLGLICASFNMERLIYRVGHIRAFSAFSSALAVISLLHGIFVIPWLWLILRFASGIATAGLFIVIESWLLVIGTIKTRGQILALYMVALYAAQAIGQLLINVGHLDTLLPFAIIAMLSSLAVIPLAIMNVGPPKFEEPSTLSFKKLYKVSASGVLGCINSGLLLGGIYGLFPLFIAEKTGSNSEAAFFMFLIIFGGMSLQYPVGRLSDIIERSRVLIGTTIGISIMSIVMMLAFHWYWLAALTTFFFGGLTFTVYPISISLACDSLDAKDTVSGTQGLLLAYSIGATIGPIVSPIFIHLFGPNGFFIYFMIVSASLGGFLTWRRTQVAPKPQEEHFIPLTQTTPLTAELDPRGE